MCFIFLGSAVVAGTCAGEFSEGSSGGSIILFEGCFMFLHHPLIGLLGRIRPPVERAIVRGREVACVTPTSFQTFLAHAGLAVWFLFPACLA